MIYNTMIVYVIAVDIFRMKAKRIYYYYFVPEHVLRLFGL